MRTIIITYGLPASGKSTWAKEQIQKNPDRYKRVNKDELRSMLDNDKFTLENEKFTLFIRDKIVEKSLRDGWDVIVDDTNFPVGGKHFLRMCEIAQLVGDVQVVEKYFDVPLKEALKRNTSREKEVPEDIIYNMYEKHIKNKMFECQTYYAPPLRPLEQDRKLPPCVIFDIDGTLALNTSGRSAFEWHRVGEDATNEPIVNLASMINWVNHDSYAPPIRIILFSGRDAVCESETKKWLHDNNIFYDDLFMRTQGDNRKDNIVKLEMYEKYIKDKYYVEFVVDDRSQVVEMWRRLGLTCLQCANGDF